MAYWRSQIWSRVAPSPLCQAMSNILSSHPSGLHEPRWHPSSLDLPFDLHSVGAFGDRTLPGVAAAHLSSGLSCVGRRYFATHAPLPGAPACKRPSCARRATDQAAAWARTGSAANSARRAAPLGRDLLRQLHLGVV